MSYEKTKVKLSGEISLDRTFDCGQCFRFEKDPVSGNICGIAHGKYVEFRTVTSDVIEIINAGKEETDGIWLPFLSDGDDWDGMISDLCESYDIMHTAVEYGKGIRILKQDRFETLISFVISQCNNIPRIKKLIGALCEKYGEPVCFEGELKGYSFPDAKTVASIPVSDLEKMKFGYRAQYIHNAACAALDGILEETAMACDTGEALRKLKSVEGIGEKVASCILLFGFSRYDAFPRDTWIKKAMAKYFPEVKNPSELGKYAGILQQYLFYMERYVIG